MRENKKEVTVVTVCPMCGHANEVAVNEEDYFNWSFDGALVQDAFPYLSADEREMLISGICPKCWDKLFGEEDSDEEEEEDEGWIEFESGKFIYDEMAANP